MKEKVLRPQPTSNCSKCKNKWILWNDSGDFQDVESYYSGRSIRSTGKLCVNFSMKDHPQKNSIERRAKKPRSSPRSHTSEDRLNQCRIPMPIFVTKPLTTSSWILVELPKNYMVGQRRQQKSELQFDRFPDPSSSLVWKKSIRKSSDILFWFSVGCYVVDQVTGDGWFFFWTSWNPRDQFVWSIFQISRCWTRRLPLLWTRSSRITSSKRLASRSRKPRRTVFQEDRSPPWSTNTFEWLALMT